MKSARNKVRVQKLLKVASDRYREEPQLAHGQHTPRVSGASQLNTHLERAWASGLTLEFYEQRGQMHDGAMASKYSLPAGGRLRTVSGRSSVRDPSIELNERSTVSSRPNEVGPVPDTPPAYDPWEEQRSNIHQPNCHGVDGSWML